VGDFFWVFLGYSENVSRDFDKRGGGSGAEQHITSSGALGGESCWWEFGRLRIVSPPLFSNRTVAHFLRNRGGLVKFFLHA
jgi:hypothetical protein